MIRSLVRCSRLYRNLLASSTTSPSVPSMNQIVTSSVFHHKIKNNHLDPTTEESNTPEHGRMRNYLREKLNCSKEWAEQLCLADSQSFSQTSDVAERLDLLFANGVKANVILENPGMLTLRESQLSRNLSIVKDMKPVDINDFVPLVQVSTNKLLKLKKHAALEVNVVPNRHRIYYISEAMNIEPCIVAQFISKRTFILDIPFPVMDQNLQILLKYVAPIDILHDLWAFRYKPDVIEQRLEQAKLGDKKKLMPWMVRCSKEKLLKSIEISANAKAVAGDKSKVKYLSDQLKYDVKTTLHIMQKHPDVYKVRVTKLKEVLDYLFGAGFTSVDIAESPRIFCHSLNTTRKRLDELKSLGCRPQSLLIVCKSTNEFNKFVQNWIRIRDQINEKNNKK